MKNFAMPTGEPVYFEGNILNPDLSQFYQEQDPNLNWNKPFGIFKVDIEAPLDLKNMLL